MIILLVLVLFGGIGYGYRGGPYAPYAWGGGGLVGLVLLILLILLLLGHL